MSLAGITIEAATEVAYRTNTLRLARAPPRSKQRRTDPDCFTRTYPAVVGSKHIALPFFLERDGTGRCRGEMSACAPRESTDVESGHCRCIVGAWEIYAPMCGVPGSDSVTASPKMKPRRGTSMGNEHQRPWRVKSSSHLRDLMHTPGKHLTISVWRRLTDGPPVVIQKFFFAVAYVSPLGSQRLTINSINSMKSGSARFMMVMQHAVISRSTVVRW